MSKPSKDGLCNTSLYAGPVIAHGVNMDLLFSFLLVGQRHMFCSGSLCLWLSCNKNIGVNWFHHSTFEILMSKWHAVEPHFHASFSYKWLDFSYHAKWIAWHCICRTLGNYFPNFLCSIQFFYDSVGNWLFSKSFLDLPTCKLMKLISMVHKNSFTLLLNLVCTEYSVPIWKYRIICVLEKRTVYALTRWFLVFISPVVQQRGKWTPK